MYGLVGLKPHRSGVYRQVGLRPVLVCVFLCLLGEVYGRVGLRPHLSGVVGNIVWTGRFDTIVVFIFLALSERVYGRFGRPLNTPVEYTTDRSKMSAPILFLFCEAL